MDGSVVHWEVGGRDAAGLRRFYADLFGWTVADVNPDYGLVAPVDGGIGGGILRTSGDMPPYVTFYVSVGDLDATLARAGELGGKALVPPTPIPGMGSFALFSDPEGNVIGVLREDGPAS